MTGENDEAFSAEELALLAPEGDTTDAGADTAATSETPAVAAPTEEPAGDKQAPEAGKKAATILDESASDDPAGDKEKPAAKEGKPAAETKPEAAADDAAWRDKFADRLLDRLKDKIPADKVAARREAILKQLGRYRSEFDYLVAGYSAQERIRSGEVRSKLPADATDEEKAAWRAENGIPAKAGDYEFPKIAGHKWTEADKPYIDDFKKAALAKDLTQEQLNGVAEWYAQTTQKQTETYYENLQNVDAEDAERAKATMRAELGADYKPTLAVLRRGLEDRTIMDEAAAQALVSGRFTDKDGTSRRIINLPGVRDLLVNYFKDTYGAGAFVRGDGRPTPQSDIEEADRLLRDDPDKYWREGWDQKAVKAIAETEGKGRRRAAG